MLYTTHVDKVILVSTIPSNLALDAPVNEETKKFNLLQTEQKSRSKLSKNRTPIALDSKKLKVPRHQMLYTTHVDKVILVSTIPSNLALDAPVNEETKKFNMLQTEQKSHSDTGLYHGPRYPK